MEHSDAQLREEQRRTQEAEQQAGAWAVEVIPNLSRGGDGINQLGVTVRNLGNYSIIQVEAQFSPDGKSLVPPGRTERVDEFTRISDFARSGYRGILTRDAAIRFWSDGMADTPFRPVPGGALEGSSEPALGASPGPGTPSCRRRAVDYPEVAGKPDVTPNRAGRKVTSSLSTQKE
jgi:hypothetical protein